MKSRELASNALTVWSHLAATRPDYLGQPVAGFEQITFGGIEAMLRGWVEKLDMLERARWISPDEIAIADVTLARKLSELPNLISQASPNGLGWLFSTNFLEIIADVDGKVNALTSRSARAGRELVRSLQREVVSDLGEVSQAANAARFVLDQATRSVEARDTVVAAVSAAESAASNLDRIAHEAELARAQIAEIEAFAAARRQELERLYAEAATIREAAEGKAAQVDQKLMSLAIDVDAASRQASEATLKLGAALRDARKEGLAGAFSTRASMLMWEQVVWAVVFAGAVISLGVLAIAFATDIRTYTYQELVVALLRRVALAAPAVWLGWYAAKQLGRVNKIKEDYEFKAATALAFQSYESAVAEANSPELTSELLRRAISNFGENPTRLFDGNVKEPVTPAEALLKAIDNDPALKLAERFKSLLK